METNQSTDLVIKEHNFQEAKNSLKKYIEQAKTEVELSRVPSDGGFLYLGNHKVTGSELNQITTQIQDFLISINNLNQGLVDEFAQVYKVFEYLDKDYISGIVTSIKAAEEVSKKEQKDRKDIKELVEQHKQSIAVLQKFKADIEKLKHITDIDKAWELIEKQSKLAKELSDYMADLSKLKHLKHVDSIHSDLERIKKDFIKVSEQQAEYMVELKSVREYCDSLSMIKHIKDIDKLWKNSEIVAEDIKSINKSMDIHSKAISAFDEVLRSLQEEQQEFIEEINQLVADFRDDFSNQVRTLTEVQTAKLSDIEEAQEKTFEQLSKSQTATLEQISNEQSAHWGKIVKSLEEEKTALNEQVSSITQKVKFSYIVAGGAAVLSVVQLFLNVLGVI